MNRDLLRPALVALLAVVAIAVAGATLDSAVSPGAMDRDPGIGGEDAESESWNPFDFGDSQDSEEPTGGQVHSAMGLCIEFLQRPLVVLGMVGLLALATVPVYRRAGGLGVASLLLGVVPFGVVVYTFMTKCRPRPTVMGLPQLYSGENNSVPGVSNATATGGGGGASAVDPPVILLIVGALVVLALVGVLLRTTGDQDRPPEEVDADDEPDEVVLADLAATAGDAADRIEAEPSFENEVYRAWREMTAHLDVPNPAASTPGEFARAATGAGMDREHVVALTDLFREVRYGGAEPTAEREERAVDALRAIESAYAGEGAG